MNFQPRENNVSNHKPMTSPSFPAGRAMSDQLLGNHSEIIIEHGGREYRLRLTRNGKPILTA